MQEKLNILFLSGWYHSRVQPYLGNFVVKHAEAVALRANVAALHVCSDPNLKDKAFDTTTQTINGIFTVNVYFKKVAHRFPIVSQLQKLMRYKKAHRIGMQVLETKGWKFDLVHLNILWPAGLIAKKLKKNYKIPYIITEHSTAYQAARGYKRGMIERLFSGSIAAHSSAITPVSKDLQRSMEQLGLHSKYKVVQNVVDTQLFHPRKGGNENKKIKFLHISTLIDAHKNISGMIRAVKEFSKEKTDVEFHIVGDGDIAPHIAYAQKLGVFEQPVFFKGAQTTEAVAALMREADCLVLFSNYENLPVVIIEAFASGIPVISTDVGGIAEHVNGQNGILIAAGNEQALTEALLKMTNSISEKKYDAEKLHAYAVENFSREKVCDRFMEIYAEVLKK